MADVQIYGIKNCDTMKKAFKWLEHNNIDYDFHDYKKSSPDQSVIKSAIKQHGWESVINRRGTTWRNLSENIQAEMDNDTALRTALENPSIIKRPLLTLDGDIYLGFKDKNYEEIFS